jgi:hypothetical protein
MASPPTQQMDGLLLAAKPDMYSGMIVDDTQLPTDVQRFTAMLEHSLQVGHTDPVGGQPLTSRLCCLDRESADA